MLKNTLLAFICCIPLMLTGCVAEKVITIPDCVSENLFLQTLSTIKKEIPSAKINFDVPTRKIIYSDYSGNDYPSNVIIIFTKKSINTNVFVSIIDGDENKIKNLETLLTKSVASLKIIDTKTNKDEPIQQLRRIDSSR